MTRRKPAAPKKPREPRQAVPPPVDPELPRIRAELPFPPEPRHIQPKASVALVIAVVLTAILEVLDITIVSVAIPHMLGSFGATSDQITWVLTSYLVSAAVVMPARIAPSVTIVSTVTGTSPTRHSHSTTFIDGWRSSTGTGGPSFGFR